MAISIVNYYMAHLEMFPNKGAGNFNPYPRYSDDWFRHEYPEYLKKYTKAEWEKLFKEANPTYAASKSIVEEAVKNCVRIYGEAEKTDNEFGPVCP